MSLAPEPRRPDRVEQVSLVDLLDRLLGEGVVVTGRVKLSIADVDLVDLDLHALLSSVRGGPPDKRPGRAQRTESDREIDGGWR